MNLYVKANKKVAKFLNLQTERRKLSDGNFILWQGDLIKFDNLDKINEILQNIGGILLSETEAIEELDGVQLRPLPTALDNRFK